MRAFLYIIVPLLVYIQWTAAVDPEYENCGKLNEVQVYNENLLAGLDEFPWFGRIYFTNNVTKERNAFRCVGVLVSTRHLISLAHCFQDVEVGNYVAKSVLLGDTDYGNRDNEQDCDTKGECAPLPKEYAISDIAIHPNYKWRDRLNNLAIVHLQKVVELSPYIQPICLPPTSFYNIDFLGQYFTYAGFAKRAPNESLTKKLKIVSHVRELQRCSDIVGWKLPDTCLCASSNADYIFHSGAALMGVIIDEAKVRNFYLIGIFSYGALDKRPNIEMFTKVSAHINWIYSNIRVKRSKTT